MRQESDSTVKTAGTVRIGLLWIATGFAVWWAVKAMKSEPDTRLALIPVGMTVLLILTTLGRDRTWDAILELLHAYGLR